MRHQTIILSALIAAALPGLTFAADPGTYRPGTPYYSTQAPSANICENQCSGDAACKGWNFVTVNPDAEAGVCEFNSAVASPVPSSVSISGDNGARAYSRALSSGGTNTVRVGAPAPVKTLARTTPTPSHSIRPAEAASVQTVRPGARAIRPGEISSPAPSQTRRVVRQPLPQKARPAPTSYRSMPPPVQMRAPQQQAPRRSQFQHNLDAGMAPQMRRPAPEVRQQRPQQVRPQPAGTMGGDPRLQNMVRSQTSRHRPQAAPRPGSAPPQMPNHSPSQGAASAPTQMPHQLSQQAPMQRPQTVAQAEQSLFGSLHDDVKIPKPMTAAEATNPDQPIATSVAVPVKRVTVENLLGLAGGPTQ